MPGDTPAPGYYPAPAGPSGQMDSLLGLSGPVDRLDALKEQMAQALALRNKPRHHYSTWGGALAGGLGDIVDGIHSKVDEGRIRAEEAPLQAQLQAGKENYGRQVLEGQNRRDSMDEEVHRARMEAMQRQNQPGPWAPNLSLYGFGGGR